LAKDVLARAALWRVICCPVSSPSSISTRPERGINNLKKKKKRYAIIQMNLSDKRFYESET